VHQIMTRSLAEFSGTWVLKREILQVGMPPAAFKGQAEWTLARKGLDYVERGFLKLADQPPMRAERQYHWDIDLNIYFDDGRFFHQVPKAGGDATHWCDPDRYDVTYDFGDWPNWSCTWKVSGPRKDYRLRSEYVKA
jgi:hypothetical protein